MKGISVMFCWETLVLDIPVDALLSLRHSAPLMATVFPNDSGLFQHTGT